MSEESNKSSLLKTLKEALVMHRITEDTMVGGHTWSFRSLNEGEECWRDKFISLDYGANNLSLISTERIATIAIGIYKVDGKPVEEVFEISDRIPTEQRKYLAAEALLALLKESDRDLVTELRNEYITLILDPQEEIKKNSRNSTKNSEKQTQSLTPDSTSSQEKESLPRKPKK